MTIGALLMVLFQVISVESAFEAINLDIILFLFGMFSIVSALEKSGVLGMIAIKMVSRTKGNPSNLLLVFVVGLAVTFFTRAKSADKHIDLPVSSLATHE